MSEGRQLTLLLAAGAVMMVVGFAGAALFPEACDDLEILGTLELDFSDAVDALPIDAATAAEAENLGTQLGIGPWRGAVAVPQDATLLPSESGLFIITDTDVVATRPLIGVTSAPRGREGLGLLASTEAFALVDDEGTIGVFDGEYEQERCGELPLDAGRVLDLDRGFVVTTQDQADASGGAAEEMALRTLAGDEIWVAPTPGAVRFPWAVVAEDRVHLSGGLQVETRSLRSGDVLGTLELPGSGSALQDVREGRLLLMAGPSAGEPLVVEDVDGVLAFADTAFPTLPELGMRGATLTPHGVVGHVGELLFTDRDTSASAPSGLRVLDVLASGNGFVGVLMEAQDGARAVLYFGPDAD